MNEKTEETLELLGRFESRNVTYVDPAGGWPIVWQRAHGVHVWDVAGRRYLDLTAAFGVAAAGHANARVVRAAQRQLQRLPHAMGDVHPHPLKARLVRELSRITFERWQGQPAKSILGNSGFEAVEAALKTAILATGKPGIIAFERGYHGLGYGTLNATQRDRFRRPFLEQLVGFGHFLPFPELETDLDGLEERLEDCAREHRIGAVLTEPVQGRGGIHVPPPGFLPLLRRFCDRRQILLVLDEVYTGFGRTGRWFGCEHSRTVPDLICLGKALTGGYPLSACVGEAELMDAAWPTSDGEAIHTSTFLGNPVGCAMALAQIAEIQRRRLPERAARVGGKLLGWLEQATAGLGKETSAARGQGLMAGLELKDAAGQPATTLVLAAIRRMLERGFILLPEGAASDVVSFTPPLIVAESDLERAVAALAEELATAARS